MNTEYTLVTGHSISVLACTGVISWCIVNLIPNRYCYQCSVLTVVQFCCVYYFDSHSCDRANQSHVTRSVCVCVCVCVLVWHSITDTLPVVSTFIAPTSSAVDFSLSTSSLQQSSLNLQSSTFSQHASPLYSSFQTPSLAPTSSLAPTPSLVPTSSFPLIPVILAVFGLIVILITILFLLGCVCCLKQRAKYRSLGPPQAQGKHMN